MKFLVVETSPFPILIDFGPKYSPQDPSTSDINIGPNNWSIGPVFFIPLFNPLFFPSLLTITVEIH